MRRTKNDILLSCIAKVIHSNQERLIDSYLKKIFNMKYHEKYQ